MVDDCIQYTYTCRVRADGHTGTDCALLKRKEQRTNIHRYGTVTTFQFSGSEVLRMLTTDYECNSGAPKQLRETSRTIPSRFRTAQAEIEGLRHKKSLPPQNYLKIF